MKKYLFTITPLVIILLVVAYYFFVFIPQREDGKQQEARIINYQKDCQSEIEEYFKSLDKIAPVFQRISLKAKNYVDEKGYFIDRDTLIIKCVEEKKIKLEKLYE